VYAAATQFFRGGQGAAAKLRGETLKAIEEGRGEEADVGQVVADALLALICGPMARLGITYAAVGARERNIAFAFLGFGLCEAERKQERFSLCSMEKWRDAGSCHGEAKKLPGINTETLRAQRHRGREYAGQDYCSVEWDGDVRWKDIAYQLWKIWASRERFSLCEMAEAPEGEEVWATTSGANDPNAPPLARRLRRSTT